MITKILRNHKLSLGLVHSSFVRASSTYKPSYVHCVGDEPYKYQTVGQVLKNAAEKYGDREALISCGEKRKISFNEALYKADGLASGLLNLGLERGDRVAIWAPNFEFWYISMMAIARAGLICVTLNPSYTIPELNYCLKKVGVKALIAPEEYKVIKFYEMLSTLIPDLKSSKGHKIENNQENSLRHVIIYSDNKLPGAVKFDELLNSSESDRSSIEGMQASISPDAGCNIQFTSGTTGTPKATLLSHFGMVNNAYYIGVRNEFDKKFTRMCVPLPLFHVGGCVISTLSSLQHGSTMVFPSPHYSGEETLKAIVNENCNAFVGTPTFFVDLVNWQKKLKLKLPEIDIACLGGAVLSPQVVKDTVETFKVKRISSVYGLTETSSAIFVNPPGDDFKTVEEFVGIPGWGVEAKVIDKEGNTVPFGVAGELCIRTPTNMLKYWDDEEKTRETLGEDRWLKTGDQFVLYENGYGKVVGRIKDMIIRGGENIFPVEIENHLNTHENILEAYVVGIPDQRMGEEVGAFIRLKDSSKTLDQKEVANFCKGILAHFKIPKFVFTVDDFPRTPSGKVVKYQFLEVFADKIKNLK